MSDAVVKTVSYNMHRFNSGLSMLHEMCKTYDIIAYIFKNIGCNPLNLKN